MRWVYAKTKDGALANAAGYDGYTPWTSRESAIADKDRPGCVLPGETLWRVETREEAVPDGETTKEKGPTT